MANKLFGINIKGDHLETLISQIKRAVRSSEEKAKELELGRLLQEPAEQEPLDLMAGWSKSGDPYLMSGSAVSNPYKLLVAQQGGVSLATPDAGNKVDDGELLKILEAMLGAKEVGAPILLSPDESDVLIRQIRMGTLGYKAAMELIWNVVASITESPEISNLDKATLTSRIMRGVDAIVSIQKSNGKEV
jgi:hypothetical protein